LRAVQVKATGKWVIWTDDKEPIGPYDSKAEAESDRAGLERFYKHGHKPGYITTDRRGK
jgi:hypothetical protein